MTAKGETMKKLTKQEQKEEVWKAYHAKYEEIEEQKRQVNEAFRVKCKEIDEQEGE